MNSMRTKEQQLVFQSASDFANKVLAPIAHEDDRSGAFPQEAVRKVAELGYLGMTVATEFGGSGLDEVSEAAVLEAFGKANGAVAAIAATHMVQTKTIEKYGTQEQKEQYLKLLCKGERLIGYAYAEPGAALASGADKVVAKMGAQGYELSGKKTYVANGGEANLYVVIAQMDEAAGQKGMGAFLVEKAQVECTRSVDKLGLRSFPTAELNFHQAKAELLGTQDQGMEILADIRARLDLAMGAVALGIGQAALAASAAHCNIRVQFGAPIGKLQAVQGMLTEIATAVYLMGLAVHRCAVTLQETGRCVPEAAYLKQYAMKAGMDAVMAAVQIHGGMGYSKEAEIERYFRDMRGMFPIENSNDLPLKTIAPALLK